MLNHIGYAAALITLAVSVGIIFLVPLSSAKDREKPFHGCSCKSSPESEEHHLDS
jgi:hypothetical protein